MESPGDDEAAKDPGAQQPHHQGFSDEDFEGEDRTRIINNIFRTAPRTGFLGL